MANQQMHLEPARSIILQLGGVPEVVRETGVTDSCVFKWMYDHACKGAGGYIPRRNWPGLIAMAERRGMAWDNAIFVTMPPSVVVPEQSDETVAA